MNILIVKTSSFGDIVQTFPLLAYLKNRFPFAHIDWVVEKRCSELLKSHPQIHRVIEVDTKNKTFKGFKSSLSELRKTKYDLVFDVQGNIKSGLILFFTRAKEKIGFGRKSVAEFPNLFFTNRKIEIPKGKNIRFDYLNLAAIHFQAECPSLLETPLLKITDEEGAYIEEVLKRAGDKKKIIVSPSSMWKNKCLESDVLHTFLRGLENPFYIFTYGSPKEEEEAIFFHNQFKENSLLLKKGSLALLQNLMSRADLVISMDSLPLHLAATVGVATHSFFGASSKNKYAPIGEGHIAIQGTCPYGQSFEKRCPILRTCVTGACIRNLKAKDLL